MLNLLSRGKYLRGSWADPFGYSAERRMERTLIAEYKAMITTVSNGLTTSNYAIAVDLAETPDQIRGFVPVKMDAVQQTHARQNELLENFEHAG